MSRLESHRRVAETDRLQNGAGTSTQMPLKKGLWRTNGCALQLRCTIAPAFHRREFVLLEDNDTDAMRRQAASELERTVDEKIRKCLICRSPFPSAWAGERVCRRCKSSSTWRSGALK
jgi:hypothetical protein